MIAMIKVATKAAEEIERGRGELLAGMWVVSGNGRWHQANSISPGYKN
jgi:hypothetical protein